VNFVIDESVGLSVARALAAAGHDVVHISEVAPRIQDEEVLALSVTRSAVLVTADKDFGELIHLQRLPAFGVVLLRLGLLPAQELSRIAVNALKDPAVDLRGSFTVVTTRSVRSHPLAL
jgi:predicted nuclease of predicted toxin-antitoxin system